MFIISGPDCKTFDRNVLSTPDINGDGFKDEIHQEVCDGKPGDIWARLTNPQKPGQFVGMSKTWRNGDSLSERTTREYTYNSRDAHPHPGTMDPVRVMTINGAGVAVFGLGDKVSYTRDCRWAEYPQIASQIINRNSQPVCVDTGVISEFSFMIDEVAGNVVRSGARVEWSGEVISFNQMTLIESASAYFPTPEARKIADKLLSVITADMGKSLRRHDEILDYATRDNLNVKYQNELAQIEAAVDGRLYNLVRNPEFASEKQETLTSAVKMAVNQLGFPANE